ncbi:unnamed protein product [Schistosoma mattheei]|uniref:Uncharacterized protein n=1 Tax=Schistosoma mattheei TaxID=31246 RepID=A0A183PNR5_9TREM|nr:unnamed protein product [Schistosoma mattheei]
MVVEGSRQETLDRSFVLLGTRQRGVPAILKGLVFSDGFDPVSPSFTFGEVTTELTMRLKGPGFDLYSHTKKISRCSVLFSFQCLFNYD